MKFINFGKFKSLDYLNLYNEYLNRISRYTKVEEKNIKINEDTPMYFNKIKDKIIKELKNSFNIIFTEKGKIINSLEFSEKINKNNKNNIIVGTSWGVPEYIYEYANLQIAVGKITMPHELVKVISAEQVYRAYTIINHEKYNK